MSTRFCSGPSTETRKDEAEDGLPCEARQSEGWRG